MSGQKVYKIFKETRGTVDFATLRDCLCLAPGIRFFSGNRKKGVFFLQTRFCKFSNSVVARQDLPPPGPRLGGPKKLPCRPAPCFLMFFLLRLQSDFSIVR